MYAPTFRSAGDLPSSRYVLPQFEERTAYGFKRQDPVSYTHLTLPTNREV